MKFSIFLTFILSLSSLSALADPVSNEKPKVPKEVQSGATPFPTMPTKMTKTTCGKVDLASKLGPVHDQTAGTCYAYTALDLLNFGSPKRYSALYLAIQKLYVAPTPGKANKRSNGSASKSYSVFDEIGGFKGGSIYSAIKVGMTKGLCPEYILPSSNGVLKKDYKTLLTYYHKTKFPLHPLLSCLPQTINFPIESKLMTAIGRESHLLKYAWTSFEIQNEVSRMYPRLEQNLVKEILRTSKTPDEVIKRLTFESCNGHIDKGIPLGKTTSNIKSVLNKFSKSSKAYYFEEDRVKVLNQINDQLDKGQPTGISYITGGLIQSPKPTSHGFHASVVAGRKWMEEKKNADGTVARPGGCYYLVKNSWGPDWKVKAGLKAKSSELHPGYFVVSEQQLMEHAYGATSID